MAVSEEMWGFGSRVAVILWPLTAASCQYHERKCCDPSSDWPPLQEESIRPRLRGRRINRLHISEVCCDVSRARVLN